jgi:pseudouridine synthase
MNDSVEGIRLQKVLANAGVASRRASEDLITSGAVKVNGKVVKELGTRINPEMDKVSVRGTPIQLDATRVYMALNKPIGVISSMADEFGRPDLSQYALRSDRIYNVGRLDADTSGLLILTNDGELANMLAHPKFGVTKTYIAKVEGQVTPQEINKLIAGVELEDGMMNADKAILVDSNPFESLVEIIIHSGKNRVVRRMFEAIGHPVKDLVRRQFGPIHLGPLKQGQTRLLSKVEVGALLKSSEGKQVRAPRPKSKGGQVTRPKPKEKRSGV